MAQFNEGDMIERGNTLVRATFKIEPDDLSDELWVKRVREAEWFLGRYSVSGL